MAVERYVNDNSSNMSSHNTYPHIRPSEAMGPWVYRAATSKSASYLNTGKWMLFYPKGYMDIAWNNALMAFNDGKLDTVHSMKASSLKYNNPRASGRDNGVLIFYCGGAESDVVKIGEIILEVMQYRNKYSVPFVYYKLNTQTAQGTAATGCTHNWTYKLSCDVCTKRVAVHIESFYIRKDPAKNKNLLKHSFQHIKGIGEKKEQKIWANGIIDHETYLKRIGPTVAFVASEVDTNLCSFGTEPNLHNHPDPHIAKTLARLGFWKSTDAYNDKQSCLWLAFKDAGVDARILDAMKTENWQLMNIRKIAEDHKLYVTVTTNHNKNICKYGPRDGFQVDLAIVHDYYIHNFKTDICTYALKHYDNLKDKKEWWRYYGAKKKAQKGKRGIKALKLVRLLSKSTYLTSRLKKSGGKLDNSRLCECVIQTQHALTNNLVDIFFEGLNAKEQWKIYGDFQDNTCYFDIETTGLAIGYNDITTAVIYSHAHTFFFVNGINLDYLPCVLNQYQVVVSYNGKSFDVPFVNATWKENQVTTKHLDLRHILARLNVRGGLKRCEEQLQLPKREEKDVDGNFAPSLWRAYKSERKMESLRKLLSYNFEDASRLRYLMVKAYNLNLEKKLYPFNVTTIQEPAMPENPFLFCETRNVLDIVKQSTDMLVACT